MAGKSLFLFRIFLRRLALKLPTVLQTKPTYVLLFDEDGVKEFTKPKDQAVYNPLGSGRNGACRIWALVDLDSAQEFLEPALALQKGPFFVVAATSQHHKHSDWTKKVRIANFFMKPWSFTEVLQV